MDRNRWPLTPRPAPARPDPASEGRRDLAVLVGAVTICAAAGLLALAALLADNAAIWWTVGLIALLAIGGCLAAARQHH